jgi:RNA polymerase sigma-70 factor (ECF subfamily)
MEELDRAPSGAEPHEGWLHGLDEALAALPPDQREAIRLRVEEDLSYDAVARRAGASPQVVRARVSRGLRSLRTRLDVTGADR